MTARNSTNPLFTLFSRPLRAGLSLTEVLVVMAILAILVALILPAIQQARETSRRASCANNLSQVGRALHSFESAYGAFPKLQGSPDTASSYANSPYSDTSMYVAILPWTDQSALFNSLNFSSPEALASSGSKDTLTFLLCPSDSGFGRQVGPTNYAANATRSFPKPKRLGAFDESRAVRLSDYLDGTSQTVAISEWVLGGAPGSVHPDPVSDTLAIQMDILRSDPRGLYASACDSSDPRLVPVGFAKGPAWATGGWGFTMYDHSLPVGHHSCEVNSDLSISIWTAGSRHPGGAQSLFADGHTSFVKSSISRDVWKVIGTRKGQEVLSSAGY